jgi:hypothetical protein
LVRVTGIALEKGVHLREEQGVREGTERRREWLQGK